MRKVILIGAGVGAFIAMVGVGIFGEHGLLKLRELKRERMELEKEKQSLLQENSFLERQIELLKNDLNYLEQMARKKLGLIRSDEVIIKLPEDEKGQGAKDTEPEAQDQNSEK